MKLLAIPLLLSLLAVPAMAGAQQPCDDTDLDYRIDAHSRYQADDLVLHGQADAVARISPAHDLTINGEPVTLEPPQRDAVATYRAAHDEVVALAAEIGAEAARFGVRAAFRALTAVFTLGANADATEAEIEAEADAFEMRVEGDMCEKMRALHSSHAELARLVPEFGQAFPLKD